MVVTSAESHLYAKTGRERERLIKMGLATAKAPPTKLAIAGKWVGRGGFALLVGKELYDINSFASGRMSEREFATGQSGLAGALSGAWIGMKIGAAIGGAITVEIGGVGAAPGAFLGGLIGGYGGVKMGEIAASSFYGRLDEKQRLQVATFIHNHYRMNP